MVSSGGFISYYIYVLLCTSYVHVQFDLMIHLLPSKINELTLLYYEETTFTLKYNCYTSQ
jgi:hypothetical protein